MSDSNNKQNWQSRALGSQEAHIRRYASARLRRHSESAGSSAPRPPPRSDSLPRPRGISPPHLKTDAVRRNSESVLPPSVPLPPVESLLMPDESTEKEIPTRRRRNTGALKGTNIQAAIGAAMAKSLSREKEVNMIDKEQHQESGPSFTPPAFYSSGIVTESPSLVPSSPAAAEAVRSPGSIDRRRLLKRQGSSSPKRVRTSDESGGGPRMYSRRRPRRKRTSDSDSDFEIDAATLSRMTHDEPLPRMRTRQQTRTNQKTLFNGTKVDIKAIYADEEDFLPADASIPPSSETADLHGAAHSSGGAPPCQPPTVSHFEARPSVPGHLEATSSSPNPTEGNGVSFTTPALTALPIPRAPRERSHPSSLVPIEATCEMPESSMDDDDAILRALTGGDQTFSQLLTKEARSHSGLPNELDDSQLVTSAAAAYVGDEHVMAHARRSYPTKAGESNQPNLRATASEIQSSSQSFAASGRPALRDLMESQTSAQCEDQKTQSLIVGREPITPHESVAQDPSLARHSGLLDQLSPPTDGSMYHAEPIATPNFTAQESCPPSREAADGKDSEVALSAVSRALMQMQEEGFPGFSSSEHTPDPAVGPQRHTGENRRRPTSERNSQLEIPQSHEEERLWQSLRSATRQSESELGQDEEISEEIPDPEMEIEIFRSGSDAERHERRLAKQQAGDATSSEDSDDLSAIRLLESVRSAGSRESAESRSTRQGVSPKQSVRRKGKALVAGRTLPKRRTPLRKSVLSFGWEYTAREMASLRLRALRISRSLPRAIEDPLLNERQRLLDRIVTEQITRWNALLPHFSLQSRRDLIHLSRLIGRWHTSVPIDVVFKKEDEMKAAFWGLRGVRALLRQRLVNIRDHLRNRSPLVSYDRIVQTVAAVCYEASAKDDTVALEMRYVSAIGGRTLILTPKFLDDWYDYMLKRLKRVYPEPTPLVHWGDEEVVDIDYHASICQDYFRRQKESVMAIEDLRIPVLRRHQAWLRESDCPDSIDKLFRFGVLPVVAAHWPDETMPGPREWPWKMPGSVYTRCDRIDRHLAQAMRYSLGLASANHRTPTNLPFHSVHRYIRPRYSIPSIQGMALGSHYSISDYHHTRVSDLTWRLEPSEDLKECLGTPDDIEGMRTSRMGGKSDNLLGPSLSWGHNALATFGHHRDYYHLYLEPFRCTQSSSFLKKYRDDAEAEFVWNEYQLAELCDILSVCDGDLGLFPALNNTIRKRAIDFYMLFQDFLRLHNDNPTIHEPHRVRAWHKHLGQIFRIIDDELVDLYWWNVNGLFVPHRWYSLSHLRFAKLRLVNQDLRPIQSKSCHAKPNYMMMTRNAGGTYFIPTQAAQVITTGGLMTADGIKTKACFGNLLLTQSDTEQRLRLAETLAANIAARDSPPHSPVTRRLRRQRELGGLCLLAHAVANYDPHLVDLVHAVDRLYDPANIRSYLLCGPNYEVKETPKIRLKIQSRKTRVKNKPKAATTSALPSITSEAPSSSARLASTPSLESSTSVRPQPRVIHTTQSEEESWQSGSIEQSSVDLRSGEGSPGSLNHWMFDSLRPFSYEAPKYNSTFAHSSVVLRSDPIAMALCNNTGSQVGDTARNADVEGPEAQQSRSKFFDNQFVSPGRHGASAPSRGSGMSQKSTPNEHRNQAQSSEIPLSLESPLTGHEVPTQPSGLESPNKLSPAERAERAPITNPQSSPSLLDLSSQPDLSPLGDEDSECLALEEASVSEIESDSQVQAWLTGEAPTLLRAPGWADIGLRAPVQSIREKSKRSRESHPNVHPLHIDMQAKKPTLLKSRTNLDVPESYEVRKGDRGCVYLEPLVILKGVQNLLRMTDHDVNMISPGLRRSPKYLTNWRLIIKHLTLIMKLYRNPHVQTSRISYFPGSTYQLLGLLSTLRFYYKEYLAPLCKDGNGIDAKTIFDLVDKSLIPFPFERRYATLHLVVPGVLSRLRSGRGIQRSAKLREEVLVEWQRKAEDLLNGMTQRLMYGLSVKEVCSTRKLKTEGKRPEILRVSLDGEEESLRRRYKKFDAFFERLREDDNHSTSNIPMPREESRVADFNSRPDAANDFQFLERDRESDHGRNEHDMDASNLLLYEDPIQKYIFSNHAGTSPNDSPSKSLSGRHSLELGNTGRTQMADFSPFSEMNAMRAEQDSCGIAMPQQVNLNLALYQAHESRMHSIPFQTVPDRKLSDDQSPHIEMEPSLWLSQHQFADDVAGINEELNQLQASGESMRLFHDQQPEAHAENQSRRHSAQSGTQEQAASDPRSSLGAQSIQPRSHEEAFDHQQGMNSNNHIQQQPESHHREFAHKHVPRHEEPSESYPKCLNHSIQEQQYRAHRQDVLQRQSVQSLMQQSNAEDSQQHREDCQHFNVFGLPSVALPIGADAISQIEQNELPQQHERIHLAGSHGLQGHKNGQQPGMEQHITGREQSDNQILPRQESFDGARHLDSRVPRSHAQATHIPPRELQLDASQQYSAHEKAMFAAQMLTHQSAIHEIPASSIAANGSFAGDQSQSPPNSIGSRVAQLPQPRQSNEEPRVTIPPQQYRQPLNTPQYPEDIWALPDPSKEGDVRPVEVQKPDGNTPEMSQAQRPTYPSGSALQSGVPPPNALRPGRKEGTLAKSSHPGNSFQGSLGTVKEKGVWPEHAREARASSVQEHLRSLVAPFDGELEAQLVQFSKQVKKVQQASAREKAPGSSLIMHEGQRDNRPQLPQPQLPRPMGIPNEDSSQIPQELRLPVSTHASFNRSEGGGQPQQQPSEFATDDMGFSNQPALHLNPRDWYSTAGLPPAYYGAWSEYASQPQLPPISQYNLMNPVNVLSSHPMQVPAVQYPLQQYAQAPMEHYIGSIGSLPHQSGAQPPLYSLIADPGGPFQYQAPVQQVVGEQSVGLSRQQQSEQLRQITESAPRVPQIRPTLTAAQQEDFNAHRQWQLQLMQHIYRSQAPIPIVSQQAWSQHYAEPLAPQSQQQPYYPSQQYPPYGYTPHPLQHPLAGVAQNWGGHISMQEQQPLGDHQFIPYPQQRGAENQQYNFPEPRDEN